jgi:hypothetical protein
VYAGSTLPPDCSTNVAVAVVEAVDEAVKVVEPQPFATAESGVVSVKSGTFTETVSPILTSEFSANAKDTDELVVVVGDEITKRLRSTAASSTDDEAIIGAATTSEAALARVAAAVLVAKFAA